MRFGFCVRAQIEVVRRLPHARLAFDNPANDTFADPQLGDFPAHVGVCFEEVMEVNPIYLKNAVLYRVNLPSSCSRDGVPAQSRRCA